MARSIGPVRPQQQMARALGAPQARPAGGNQRVPHPSRASARPQAQAMLTNRQRRAPAAPGSLGGGTIDVGRFFGDGGGGGAMAGASQGNLKCSDCGMGLIAGFDAMDDPDRGLGNYLCKNCWADMWVPHPHGNISSLAGTNTCTMGVRWTPQEWEAIQGLANHAIQMTAAAVGHLPTNREYPSIKMALDPVLGKHFKRSMKCQTCNTNISFSPTSDDIPMNGINTTNG